MSNPDTAATEHLKDRERGVILRSLYVAMGAAVMVNDDVSRSLIEALRPIVQAYRSEIYIDD